MRTEPTASLCPGCGGSGKVGKERCNVCGGSGQGYGGRLSGTASLWEAAGGADGYPRPLPPPPPTPGRPPLPPRK